MKKIMIIVFMLGCLSLCSCGTDKTDLSKLEDISIACDMAEYNFQELEKEADIVAKIEVLDDLTPENSEVAYIDLEDERFITSAISRRKLKVIEYYKNNSGEDKTQLSVIDGAAIVENCLYHNEGYYPLEKGGIYIVFLSNDTASGEYSLISDLNSLVDVESPFDDESFAEIKVKSLVKYESDLSDKEKKTFIDKNVKIAKGKSNKKSKKVKMEVAGRKKKQKYKVEFDYEDCGEDVLIYK